jgi:hypothetical protein
MVKKLGLDVFPRGTYMPAICHDNFLHLLGRIPPSGYLYFHQQYQVTPVRASERAPDGATGPAVPAPSG